MSEQELLVKISGDATALSDAFDKAKEETEKLSETLKKTAEYAAVAFAALTAEAYLSVEAFKAQQEAANNLTQTLQQQGIYSKELYESYIQQAEAIEKVTGADKEQIVNGQALLQSMVGQTEISGELTKAVVDLAAKKKIDLFQAFSIVGKAATENTEILKRYGINIADTGTRSGNLAAITKELSQAYGGSAEALTQGLGATRLLSAAYDNVQKAIGERLAPAFETLIRLITEFFKFVEDHPFLIDLAVALGAAAAAVTGLIAGIGALGVAFLSLNAILAAFGVTANIALAGIPAAIGAIIAITVLVYENWNTIWPKVYGVFKAFTDSILPLLKGIGELILGAFSLDPSLIKKGIEDVKAAIQTGAKSFQEVQEDAAKKSVATEEKKQDQLTDANRKGAADREAETRRHENLKLQIEADKHKVTLEKLQQANSDVIKLTEEELKVLEQLNDDHNKKIFGALEIELARIRERRARAMQEQQEEQKTLNDDILKNDQYYQKLTVDEQKEFLDKHGQQLRQSILTERQAQIAVAKDEADLRIKNNNQALKDQVKYGKEYAAINKLMHSEIYEGSKSAFGELAALEKSSNNTLKGIGQVAAAANIAIKTAESAMNVYAGFSTIPIVGPALGIAAAAAVIAFGAEQEQAVFAAADGGLLTGGTPGKDSIPMIGMPGELVVPTRNFDEVVNAVADARGGSRSSTPGDSGGSGSAHVSIELKKNFMDILEMKLVERKALGISLLTGNF